MRLQILTADAIVRLRAELVSPARVKEYRSAESCAFVATDDLLASPVDIPDTLPFVNMPTGQDAPRTDAENAQLVFQYLSGLKPIYAADGRLWAALTHGRFWAYTRWRYPRIPTTGDASGYIRSHWFVVGTGLASLRRNAVARLWWAAWLTVAPWDRDPELSPFKNADRFHYTKVMLSSQQVYQDVMERDFGSNTRVRICFLDAFDRYRARVSAPDRLMKRAVTRLNLLLEYRHLVTLPAAEVHKECMNVVAAAAESLDVVEEAES